MILKFVSDAVTLVRSEFSSALASFDSSPPLKVFVGPVSLDLLKSITLEDPNKLADEHSYAEIKLITIFSSCVNAQARAPNDPRRG